MVRYVILAVVVAGGLLLAWPILPGKADPAEEKAIQTQLAIQQTMEQAMLLRAKGDHAKAVQILEEQIARVNGNATYMTLLRETYRSLIRDLLTKQQRDLAEKYRQRLSIIDNTAVNDPSLRPSVDGKAPVAPTGLLAKPANAPVSQPITPGGPIVRAKNEDPFDLTNRLTGDNSERLKMAKTLLAQAEAAFMATRFAQARLFYEQAYQADPSSVASSQERWAYTKLIVVVDQLNQKDIDVKSLGDWHREVLAATTMFPALKDYGQPLLAKIEALAKTMPAASKASPERSYTIEDKGANAQGWLVIETTHFRIIHKQPRELVNKVAHVAEKTRYEMYQKWFGNAGPAWNPKCDIYLHASAQEYAKATGVAPSSPGHARIESESGTGRVVGRRLEMHVDSPAMLDAVLPHETTHVVLAGQFGAAAVPRWADEGMAVLTEPPEKIEVQRRNLVRGQRDGMLFKVRDLMSLADYPQPRQMSAFYAQSVALVEFMTREKGPQVFSAFLRDGLKDGYDPALKKHYGWDFNTLQDNWGRHMTAEVTRMSTITAGK